LKNRIKEHAIEQLGKLKIPGIVHKASITTGKKECTGPKVAEHTETVYRNMCIYKRMKFIVRKKKE